MNEEQRITEAVRKNPVQMTSRQQSILASLCEVVAGLVRATESGVEPNAEKALDDILSVAWKSDVTAVEFGQLYDKLHRTGANA